jgi:hypothetical protein
MWDIRRRRKATQPRVQLQNKPNTNRKRRQRTSLFRSVLQIQLLYAGGVLSFVKTMVESVNRHQLLRLSVSWPLAIKTASGEVYGETRNVTGEGFYLYCSERLHEGVAYPVKIKLSEKQVEITGKVTWSNLDNCTSFNFNSAMGFYFMKIERDKDKQILAAAILARFRKLPHLKQETDRHNDSYLYGEEEPKAYLHEIAVNTRLSRN